MNSVHNRHARVSFCILHSAFCIAALALATASASALTVTDVAARQRWPWNSLVDVDFTIGGAGAGDAFAIDITATCDGGTKTLRAKTFASEPIGKTGSNRLVWNFGADYPDFKAEDLQVTVTATPFSDSTPVYLVVDLSAGANAESYAVRYTTTAPEHTAGVADPCKTSELWLKRVKAGTIAMGSGGTSARAVHTCTLTSDFYLGIFSITQAQWENVGYDPGTFVSVFTNAAYRATRPADSLKYNWLYSHYSWPDSDVLSADCFLKRLRDRTGLNFNLPTEWQWEYACRAGSTDARYPDAQYRCSSTTSTTPPADYEYSDERGMWGPEYGTSYVDEYPANPWGFYGMLGNVWEWCANLNPDPAIAANDSVVDPLGNSPAGLSAANARKRITKGGCWSQARTYSCAYSFRTQDSWNSTLEAFGARVCLTIVQSAE